MNLLIGGILVVGALFFANYFTFNLIDYTTNQEIWISVQTVFLVFLGAFIASKDDE